MSQVMTHQEAERQKAAKIADARSRLTVDDYNRVLEDYLLGKRSERGYTDREPSDYYNSSVARWAQDARDWIAFRDSVMTYGLQIINDFYSGKQVPSIDGFKAELEKIECNWTYEVTDGQIFRV